MSGLPGQTLDDLAHDIEFYHALDLDMIEWAGTGVCVANGNALVRQKADLIIGSCENDGVAEYLESIFA